MRARALRDLSIPHWLIASACFGLVGLIAVLDRASGVHIALGPFYLVPISVAAWYLGSRLALWMACVSVMAGLGADRFSGSPDAATLVPWWNAGARLAVFLFLVYLIRSVAGAIESARASARRAEEVADRLQVADGIKNTFLNAVSHELRSPLAAILGCARTLEDLEETLDPEDRRGLTRAVAVNARKLDRLLGELLDLDRLSRRVAALEVHPVDLAKVAAQVISDLDIPLERPIHLEADSVPARVDEAKVERIVENLLGNALKYSSPGTPIWVRVSRVSGVPTIEVEDAGPGVPPDRREAVFQPFERGEAARQGVPGIGIGLALVREFAGLHGGRAWVEQGSAGGARFVVELPDGGALEDERPPALLSADLAAS